MKRPEESTDEPAGKAGTGEPAPPSGGDRAARYALGREIGRGGLGRVVEARDAELERDVAVKLVLDGVSAEMLERFLIEARVTAGLEHPNIVPVHDLVRDADGRVMLCMPLPIRTSAGLREIGLSGNIRIQIRPPRLM